MVYGRPHTSRAIHFIPLALLRYIAELSHQQLPEEIAYLGDHGIKAIEGAFGNRRTYEAFDLNFPKVWIWPFAVGWVFDALERMLGLMGQKPKKKGEKVKGSISNVDNPAKQDKTRVNPRNHDDDESKDEKRNEQGHIALNASAKRKRGTVYTDVEIGDIGERPGVRRSNRAKK